MFSYSGIQLARRMGHKLDYNLRQELVKAYYSFRAVPCFLHRTIDFVRRKSKNLPLVIEFEEDGFDLGMQYVKGTKCRIFNELPSISSCSTKLSIEKIGYLLDNCHHVKKIYYDRKITALLDTATPSINSHQLSENGLTGKDTTIAIVDSGIHPHKDIEGRIKGFKDFIKNRTAPYDDNGHGTHCAGDAAGNGAASNGKYKAPAFEANLVGVKVLDKMGSGSLSSVISGIQWCIQNQSELGINVLSLSLGSPATQTAEDDPVIKAVERAWDNGIVVCVAAGNEGPSSGTIASPGISPKVITVGAIDDRDTLVRSDDRMADFSSRGPTIEGEMKPDVVIPGVNIISLRSPRSFLDRTNSFARVDRNYFSLSGTSMATPICAGVVAQLLQKDSSLSPNQVKEQLIGACEDLGQPPNVQGHGYLDASKLISD